MSDVIVSTTESTTNVTTTNDVTTIAITDTVVEVSQATAGLQGPPGANSDPIYIFVRNATGAQLNKGTIVYVSGANGTHVQVTPASASSDATSARTVGWLAEDIGNNASGLCQIEGYLEGVNTQAFNEGDQLYLSTTAGGFTATKPQAPTHLVYVGVVAKKSAGNGKVFVKVQNGYELDELHNVQIISVADKNLIQYDSATDLWKNVAATAITVGSAITAGTASYSTNAGTSVYASTSGTAVSISGTITRSQVSDYASGTVANITGSITRSQVSNFASGTVAVATVSAYADESGTALYATNADYATTSGTAVFATNASTAVYATTSGTSVSITGSITRSQVSDYASGTVANISGTVTQSQVSNLTTDLAGKANLAGGNSFTGAQVIATAGTAEIPLIVRGTAGQSANLLQIETASATAIRVNQVGNTTFIGNITSQNNATFTPNSSAIVPLTIRGASGQSANLLELQNSGSTAVALVTSAGALTLKPVANAGNQARGILLSNTSDTWQSGMYLKSDASGFPRLSLLAPTGSLTEAINIDQAAKVGLGFVDPPAQLSVASGLSTRVATIVRGAASQSANLQEWQDSAGGTAARVNSTGSMITSQGFAVLGGASISGSIATLLQTSNAARIPLVVQGFTSQSANLTEWQNSSGGTVLSVNSAGLITATRQLAINSGAAGETLFVTRGAVSQTGDQIAVRDSNANTIAGFSATGRLYSGVSGSGQTYLGGLNLGSVNTVATQLGVIAGTATTVGAVIRGASSQSADLTQWQNTGGTVIAKVDVNGNIFTGDMGRATSSVNTIHISNGTIPSANPTGGGVLYVEAGALKYRGSSGTITTIANA